VRYAVGLEAPLVEDGRALRVVGARERVLAVLLVDRLLAVVAHEAELRARRVVARGREVAARDGEGGPDGGWGEQAMQAERAHAALL
jgi:hypothetical protein